MLSTSDIVKWANEQVSPLISGAKTYGLAKTVSRDDKIIPYADETYIGIDDTYPAQIYHRELSITSAPINGSGYGDSQSWLQNTYQMSMIVFFNEAKTSLTADKLYTFIQKSITGILKIKGYKNTRVSVLNAILNDGLVWRQEYGDTPLKLFSTQRLIQINYSITFVFDPQCIDLPNCKK